MSQAFLLQWVDKCVCWGLPAMVYTVGASEE